MTVTRCTAKLLKRLKLPAKLVEPQAPTNPLGEWYADIDFIDREPFVLMLNVATGAGLVLPGRAADLKRLPALASQQLGLILRHYGIDPDQGKAAEEVSSLQVGISFANTRDRSVQGSMNQFRQATWAHFAYHDRSLPEAASRQWEGLYRHPSFAPSGRKYSYQDWHRPLDLVRRYLLPSAEIIPFRAKQSP